MGWLGWGLYAARRIARGPRRKPFFYTNLGMEIAAQYIQKSAQKKQVASTPVKAAHQPGEATTLTAPASFTLHGSWEWDESDLDYYRYATEKWKVYTFEHWGVLEFPAGKDAAHNFFGIIQLHEHDDKGSLAHGEGPGGDIAASLPVLVLFRTADSYNSGFAAVQSWSLIEELIEQDRPLQKFGRFPRAVHQQ